MTSRAESLENSRKRLQQLQSSLDVLKEDFRRGAIGVRAYRNKMLPIQAKIRQAEEELGVTA
ncbi:MAG: hypothetical protein JRN62_10150 [Nitrososphaerota archaeon]|jgi:hypothetical protein|nr:hypothetical protein [Nitrososphaerota archaeon]MDG6949826.1 hypothetical protein [Nitrososphaerota archaeon]